MGALPEFSPDLPARRPRRKRYSERLQELRSSQIQRQEQPVSSTGGRLHSGRRLGPARIAASLAIVAGPALLAQLVLSQLIRPQSEPALPGSTASALLTQVSSLQSWLQEADTNASPSALTTRLQAIQDRLSGLPASHCQLLSRNELLDLNSRLTIDLASGGGDAPRTPSWQTRYGDQIGIAERNLHNCLKT